MQIIVNGKAMETEEHSALAALIQRLSLDPSRLVVELNSRIIPRAEYESRTLSPGDKVELVRLVGGG